MNDQSGEQSRIPSRVWVSVGVVLLVLLFISSNRSETSVSFVFFTAVTPLWVALSIAGAGGFFARLLM